MPRTYYRKYLDKNSHKTVPAATATRRAARREIYKRKYELVFQVLYIIKMILK